MAKWDNGLHHQTDPRGKYPSKEMLPAGKNEIPQPKIALLIFTKYGSAA